MKRVVVKPREDLEEKALWNKVLYVEERGIEWSDCEWDNYWNEEGKVVISQKAEKQFLEATYQLHNMHLAAVDKV
jgi:glutathionylspermidine synthase